MNINSSTLQLDNDVLLKDIRYTPTKSGSLCKGSLGLKLLDLVDCAKVPFAYVAGPSQDVWTEDEATSTWFTEQLSPDETQNPLSNGIGVLAEVVTAPELPEQVTRFTKVLFFLNVKGRSSTRDHSAADEVILKAVPICSEVAAYLPSPPLSPRLSIESEHGGQLLPPLSELQAVSLANERKRKQVSSVFDEATERRRKGRRHGGESVAAATSLQSDITAVNVLVGHKRPKQPARTLSQPTSIPAPRPHSRTGSISGIPHAPEPPRRMLSRSPSMSSDMRPASRKGPLEVASKRSALSRVSSLTDTSTTEERNKDAISRLVMAGLRLYGLQQSRRKHGHARRTSEVQLQSQSNVESAVLQQEDAAKDEEYKLIYHQTYKGAVFAFRKVIATEPLFSNPTLVQDTVDRLLAIFCIDPMAPS